MTATLPPQTELDTTRTTVAVLDLPSQLTVITSSPQDNAAMVTVRSEGRVVDTVRLPSADDIPAQVAALHLPKSPVRAWKRGGGEQIFASVVLCTVGTNPVLPRAVEAILASRHPNFELVVVDNAPASGATRRALAGFNDPRMIIVEEPTPGLSRARNKGVDASAGEIVAFTDDDALVDESWLSELLDVFAADPQKRLGAVTGAPHPAELQYRSQRMFEARGGFPTTSTPTLWATALMPISVQRLAVPTDGGPLYPFVTTRVGAGVAMAFRRDALDEMGPFDPALGAGTIATGGEDLDAFARILRLGYGIITTPDALVHHFHRPTMAELMRQTRADGVGVAALLTKTVLTNPSSLLTLVRRVPAVLRRVSPTSERVRGSDPDTPISLTGIEVRGFLTGPAHYLRSLRQQRRL